MSIQFNCPHCDRFYKVDEKYAGKLFACKECREPIRAPLVSAASVAGMARKKSSRARDSAPRRPPPTPAPVLVTIHAICPHCGRPHNLEAKHAGKLIRCKKCAEPFRVPLSSQPVAAPVRPATPTVEPRPKVEPVAAPVQAASEIDDEVPPPVETARDALDEPFASALEIAAASMVPQDTRRADETQPEAMPVAESGPRENSRSEPAGEVHGEEPAEEPKATPIPDPEPFFAASSEDLPSTGEPSHFAVEPPIPAAPADAGPPSFPLVNEAIAMPAESDPRATRTEAPRAEESSSEVEPDAVLPPASPPSKVESSPPSISETAARALIPEMPAAGIHETPPIPPAPPAEPAVAGIVDEPASVEPFRLAAEIAAPVIAEGSFPMPSEPDIAGTVAIFEPFALATPTFSQAQVMEAPAAEDANLQETLREPSMQAAPPPFELSPVPVVQTIVSPAALSPPLFSEAIENAEPPVGVLLEAPEVAPSPPDSVAAPNFTAPTGSAPGDFPPAIPAIEKLPPRADSTLENIGNLKVAVPSERVVADALPGMPPPQMEQHIPAPSAPEFQAEPPPPPAVSGDLPSAPVASGLSPPVAGTSPPGAVDSILPAAFSTPPGVVASSPDVTLFAETDSFTGHIPLDATILSEPPPAMPEQAYAAPVEMSPPPIPEGAELSPAPNQAAEASVEEPVAGKTFAAGADGSAAVVKTEAPPTESAASGADNENSAEAVTGTVAEPGTDAIDETATIFTPPGQQEVSESGSPIYRHQPRPGPSAIAPPLTPYLAHITNHIQRTIGPAPIVFHEIISVGIHLDLHVVPPSRDPPSPSHPRGSAHFTIVTSGLSSRPMNLPPGCGFPAHAELMICLPVDWPGMKLDGSFDTRLMRDEANWWPLRWLKAVARMPHEYNTFLGPGHTIPNGAQAAAFSSHTRLGCMLVQPSLLNPRAGRLVASNNVTIQFYALWPIYPEEMELKQNLGIEALLQRFKTTGTSELIQLDRKNVAAKARSR